MSWIQLILLAGVGLALSAYLFFFRSMLWDRLIAAGLVVLAVGGIISPETTTWVANKVGVGRGADLLIYLSIVTGAFIAVLLYSRIQRLQRAQTELVRHLAILSAKKPS